MTWNTPVSPVAGTVITVAWATANVVDPITWLRLMTGNADPPGSSYVVMSSSSSATSWSKVTGDAMALNTITSANLAPGAAVGNVGYTPANKAGDTFTGDVTVPNLTLTGMLALPGGTGNKIDLLGLGSTVGIGINTAQIVMYAPTNVEVVLRDSGFNGALRGTFWHSGTFNPADKADADHTTHVDSLELTSGQVVFFPSATGRKIDLLGEGGPVGIGIAASELALFGPTNVNVTLRDSSPSGTLRGQFALQNGAGRVPNASSADNALALGGIVAANYWHSGNFDPTSKAAANHTTHAGSLELTGSQVVFFPATTGRKVDLLGLGSTVGLGTATNEIALFGPTNVNVTLRDSSPSGTLRGTFWHSGNFTPSTKSDTTHTTHAGSLELTGSQVVFFPATSGRKIDLLGNGSTVGIGIATNEIALFGPSNVNITLRDSSPSGTLRGQVALQNPSGRVPNATLADTATNATSADDSVRLGGRLPGHANGNIPISDGTINTSLNADLVRNLFPGNASGNIPISNGTVNTNLVAASATTASQLGGVPAASYALLAGPALTGTPTINGNTAWHAGNDGPGSGLDADTVDGQHATAFSSSTHVHSRIDFALGGAMADDVGTNSTMIVANGNLLQVFNEAINTQMFAVGTAGATVGGQTVIHAGNIGSQSVASATNATNAAQLGGVVAANYALKASPALTGTPTINGDAVPVVAYGSYSGTGGADRQITTGFQCKYVRLTGVIGTARVTFDLFSGTVGNNVRIAGAAGPAPNAGIGVCSESYLHASDGFVVNGSGFDASDNSGGTYFYAAFG